MFEWRQEYAFGLEDIDIQHKRLFEIGQNLECIYADEDSANQYVSIKEAVLELENYADYHFDYEEEWLSLIGFKEYLTHQAEHDVFTKKIAELKTSSKNIKTQPFSIINETLSFLANWIIDHVMLVDIEYVEAVKLYREKHTSLI